MGLLDKLKSLFGSDQNGHSPARDTEPKVTVEHEPAAESEHAVKGTDGVQQQVNDEQESGDSTAESVSESEEAATDESESSVASTTEHTQPGPVTDEPAEDEPVVDERAESPTKEQATLDEELDTGEESTADEDPVTDESTDSPSVEELKGIGPTYAERLEAIGVETIADLAAADPATVAEAAQTGENRASDWVERARSF